MFFEAYFLLLLHVHDTPLNLHASEELALVKFIDILGKVGSSVLTFLLPLLCKPLFVFLLILFSLDIIMPCTHGSFLVFDFHLVVLDS